MPSRGAGSLAGSRLGLDRPLASHLQAVEVEMVVVVGRWQVGSGSVRFGGRGGMGMGRWRLGQCVVASARWYTMVAGVG